MIQKIIFMHIPFEEMPKSARVWIYQANRSFSKEEKGFISTSTKKFLDQWIAHGTQLKSSFKIFHHKFLILSVDEQVAKASGCSIDASVGLIKSIESNLNLNFFDRSKIAFLINDKVFLYDLKNIKALISEGTIKNQTLTFNNLVKDISQLEKQWIIPAKDSWLRRYF